MFREAFRADELEHGLEDKALAICGISADESVVAGYK